MHGLLEKRLSLLYLCMALSLMPALAAAAVAAAAAANPTLSKASVARLTARRSSLFVRMALSSSCSATVHTSLSEPNDQSLIHGDNIGSGCSAVIQTGSILWLRHTDAVNL
jgi:hypothetical protein